MSEDKLTDHEQEILRLFASGTSNIEIADRLNLTQEAVRNQIRFIISKLNAKDRAHAVRLATQKGLLTHARLATVRS